MRPGASAACLACDIGGSSISAAVVTPAGGITGRVDRALDSRAAARAVLDQIAAALADVLQLSGVAPDRLGLAVPGPFDERAGSFLIRKQGKFEALHGLPLIPELYSRLPQLERLPVLFVNDARAFALGELHYGAAKGSSRTVILTLGTGCGSAFAVEGRLVTEGPGVPEHGFVYPLEYLGTTIDELFSTRGLHRRWTSRGRQAGSVEEIAALAHGGDSDAADVFREFGSELVRALAPVLRGFRADRLVTGGGITRAFGLFGPAARAESARQDLALEIVPASSLTDSALLGAASLTFQGEPE